MPKSKEQKRKEAIERARQFWPVHLKSWLYIQAEHDSYRKRFDDDVANKRLDQARNAFISACHRASVDTSGNPV